MQDIARNEVEKKIKFRGSKITDSLTNIAGDNQAIGHGLIAVAYSIVYLADSLKAIYADKAFADEGYEGEEPLLKPEEE